MGISGTAIALPRIADDLGSAPGLLQWVVNGFNVSFALSTLAWGVLSDRIGYRATFRLGIALSLAAGLASAATPSLVVLDIARAVAGVGGAAVLTGGSALLSNAFDGAARGRAFAIFGTVVGLGLAVGPTLSGALISWIDWRGVFVAHALVLLVALVGTVVLPHIRHRREPGRKVVDFGLLRNPHFLALCLVPVSGAIGFVTLLTYLPVALSGIADLSAGTAGLVMLPMTIPVLIGPLLAARLVRTTGATSMSIIYAALASLILGSVGMLALTPTIPLGWLILPMVLLGFGFGLPVGLVDSEALAAVPADSSGTAAGVLNFVRIGSEAIVVAGYSALLAWLIGRSIADPVAAQDAAAGRFGHPDAYADAFGWVIVTMVVLLVITTAAIALLHRARVAAAR
ncbi:MFS transporter [Antrihabitans sp. YC3-6]|uniref:MFS transporter n=2 Tax=Antrihabitans stalagmiti TaxID=2799499 RepID=A0A934NM57_9NOCA|nr:MFS transporter [Antrihabitans stalagmiti]